MIRRVAVFVCVCLGFVPSAFAAPLLLAEGGTARATILVAADALPSEQYAAEELQRFLGEMSGATFALVHRVEEVQTPLLIDVGNVRGALPAPTVPYGNEEYQLRTQDNAIIIAGGRPRGVLYGAYALLEDVLGCRWFTTEVSRIPQLPRLEVPDLDLRYAPPLEYREPFTYDGFDGDWAARNRANGNTMRLEERHGGKVVYHGFVHTFEYLVPVAEYFDTHPEYFSEVNGVRRKDRSQLCCTNEDVKRIITERIRTLMREHPEATVFSISQNDWFNFCTCGPCSALAEQEGSEIAPVLALVNHVADAVRDEFPDKVIDTLAYQWTRKPPKTMRPAPNVVVRLCSIECCFAHAFTECRSRANREFVDDAIAWGKTGARLWVWDYVTSFSNYLTPFPNLRVRQPNIQFFIENGVRGIFEQDVYQTPHGEFSELSAYLNAKLLWNPAYDVDTAIDEFLAGVYGAGAPHLRAYLNELHDSVKPPGAHMSIWVGPNDRYLEQAVLDAGDAHFDAAEAAVADDPGALERVKIARLSVDYAQLERARHAQDALYEVDHAAFTVRLQPAFRARVGRFFDVAERCGFSTIREFEGALADYKKYYDVFDADRVLTPYDPITKALHKRGLNYAYYEGVFEDLPDFAALTPVTTGHTPQIGLRPAEKPDAIALDFRGYFDAPEDGVYTFALRSNDGSQMWLWDEMLIDNGGLHKLETVSGVAALRKGPHPVRVTYFESGGEEGLELLVSGPGIEQRKVPAKWWLRD